MHSTESRSITRAALILLTISLVRWAVPVQDEPSLPRSPDILVELTESTRAAADDAERRGRPLAAGERLDPNRADAADLDRLPGVGPATAEAIVAARDTGTVFRRADDLLVVRGIGPALVARVRTSLEVSDPPRSGARRERPSRASDGARLGRAQPPRTVPSVDVNRAGTEELQRLPGVGPALATRILAERRKRPFTSVDDLVRVSGIGTATVERLRGLATVSRTP